MRSEEDYVRLVDDFERRGFHVSRRMTGGADTVVVASKPETLGGITVYQRSVHLFQSKEGQWHTVIGGVTLPWVQTLGLLRGFVSDLMGSEDSAYLSEQDHRLGSVGGRA